MIKNTLILILFFISVSSCSNNSNQTPKAVKGVLDLRNWHFEKDGIVKLDGEWEFYWQKFLRSNDFDSVKNKHYIKIPDVWNGFDWNGVDIPGCGYATYNLKIIKRESSRKLALKLLNVSTAYKLFINDVEIGNNGVIGKSKETSKPQYLSQIFSFNSSDTINIIVQVSNFNYRKGGIWLSIELGNEIQIKQNSNYKIIFDCFLAGGLFFVFFYLTTIYILRQEEKASLYFSLICLNFFLRILVTNDVILSMIFPQINWEFLVKIELITMYITIPLFCLYLNSLIYKLFSKLLINISLIIAFLSITFVILTPAVIHTHIVQFNQIIVVTYYLLGLFLSFKAVLRKADDSLILFVAMFIYFIAVINTFLFVNYFVNTFDSMNLGLVVFVTAQTILLSRKYSKAYLKIENFANEMKLEVTNKTQDLRLEKEKTEELLKQSDKLLLNVLPEPIANRLKSGETTIADHFEEASVVFIDIADFTKMSAKSTPQKMVNMLNEIFSIFDKISAKYGLEKIKTIGDCYMAAAGIPVPRKDHAQAIALMALEVMENMKGYSYSSDDFKSSDESYIINFRIGLDCGPIVAGVIGEQKFIYDLWGDMVNTASRMETNGIIGKIQCTERFKEKIEQIPLVPPLSKVESAAGGFYFEERGVIEVKGKGLMKTYFLEKFHG